MVGARRALAVVVIILLIVGAAFVAFAWRLEIAAVGPPAAQTFDPDLVRKGFRLAALGNCIACHTVPGRKAFAGGLEVPTPFGSVYSTNITPDPETGIGRWSEAAFRRSLREGVDREGNHLYPAFPYGHFTRTTDEDISALYAFFMTREPVRATAPEKELVFPTNIRMLLAGWKLLYLDQGPFRPDPDQSEEWNRGAYLAEGLGHCGSCHTPRNFLGAEEASRHFGGGVAEGWVGYAINENSPAPVPWSQESLAFYLRHGWHELHGVSQGPMAEVTGNLEQLPDEDIAAIATYVGSIMNAPAREPRLTGAVARETVAGPGAAVPAADSLTVAQPENPQDQGAAIYVAACAPCHDSGRQLPYGALNFALSTAVNASNPQNIIDVVLFGLPAAEGQPSSTMPGFAGVLTNREMAALLDYMRDRFSDEPLWENVEDMVRATRTGDVKVAIRPSDGIERAPANIYRRGGLGSGSDAQRQWPKP